MKEINPEHIKGLLSLINRGPYLELLVEFLSLP